MTVGSVIVIPPTRDNPVSDEIQLDGSQMAEAIPRFRRLLVRSIAALAVGAVLIGVCYVWVDRPVAFLVHDHPLPGRAELIWITKIDDLLVTAAPVVLIAVVVTLAFRPLTYWQDALLAIALALIVSAAIAEGMKPLFGRTWPETWVDNNPSLIGDGTYGFHPLRTGVAYTSFPSGHTTAIFAAVSILWAAYPRLVPRLICAALAALVVVALVVNNYHFVSDTIAGALIGAVTGTYVLAFRGSVSSAV